jgi:hypothetical protein
MNRQKSELKLTLNQQKPSFDSTNFINSLYHFKKENRHGISIIIPLIGSLHRERVKACVCCLKNQIKVDLEIIIVQPSNESPIKEISKDVIRVEIEPTREEFFSIGRLRNEGVKYSKWKHNQELRQRRANMSLCSLIEEDLKLGKSTYCQYLQQFHPCLLNK